MLCSVACNVLRIRFSSIRAFKAKAVLEANMTRKMYQGTKRLLSGDTTEGPRVLLVKLLVILTMLIALTTAQVRIMLMISVWVGYVVQCAVYSAIESII